jgi:DNA-binding NarL/FixJ family response regulator
MKRAPSDGPSNVWVVEDNRAFRKSIVGLLRQTDGLECGGEFESCEGALAALKHETPPAVVLMDIGLKGMSGIEGTSRIRGISPSTQVIILTVQDDDHNVFKAICAGASGYLLKASSADSLADAIDEVTSGGAPMSPQIAKKVLDTFTKLNAPLPEGDLTEREQEVLQLLVDGLSKQQIAERLFLSFHTVDFHLRNIYSKLHVNSRSGAISKTLKERLF